jgi:uncharacterized protein YlxW (UPF0749 family)
MTGAGARLRGVHTWQVTLGLALLALGFLIAAQARSEAPRVRYTSQERAPLVETAGMLTAQQASLQAGILDLRDRIRAAEAGSQGSSVLTKELTAQLDEARLASGLIPVTGTGLVIQLRDSKDPSPTDGNVSDYRVRADDLRTIADELWLAGAEALAVNGERLTATSGFLDIGESILVNSAYLVPPYQVVAIGPQDLYDRLTRSARFADWVRTRVQGFGLEVRYAELPDAQVPAYAGSVRLRYARPVPSATPGAVP